METLTDQQIQQFRAETNGTARIMHFNNAGSSLPPDVVVETVVNYLQEEAMCGGYETEFKYRDELENTYSLIARLLNADKDEIAIVQSASMAWSIAFKGITFNKGDEVITSEMEYVTNVLGFLMAQQTHGIQIKVIPNDDRGNFLLTELEAAITPKTKLIAITHIASTTGGMMPIVEIGKIARKHGILYLIDACQSAGQVPLDVKEMGCDMLAVTGRKYLRGPRGIGFLFVRKEVQDEIRPTFLDGFSIQWVTETAYQLKPNARRFQLYENSQALHIGLGKAVEYVLHIGVDKIWQRIQYLAGLLRNKLREIDCITVHDTGDQQCGIVTFSVAGIESAAIKGKLAERHINVSVGLAKSTLYYMNKNNIASNVRASVHYYNTEEEISALCDALTEIIKKSPRFYPEAVNIEQR